MPAKMLAMAAFCSEISGQTVAIVFEFDLRYGEQGREEVLCRNRLGLREVKENSIGH